MWCLIPCRKKTTAVDAQFTFLQKSRMKVDPLSAHTLKGMDDTVRFRVYMRAARVVQG